MSYLNNIHQNANLLNSIDSTLTKDLISFQLIKELHEWVLYSFLIHSSMCASCDQDTDQKVPAICKGCKA